MIIKATKFRHQSVRDLAWAVSSPPLISQTSSSCLWPDGQWYRQMYEETLPWLKSVDDDPAELEQQLDNQKDRRMGKYFETLWYYWLSHHPRYQLIENNLQVIIDGETLGEIDLIVFDRITGRTMHWELAVKFYLGLGDTRELSSWHGPNLRDRLDKKVEHLLSKQSVLSRNPRVADWLKQQGISIDQCSVILKGRLYYPWDSIASMYPARRSTEMISPTLCAPEHLYSMWLSQSKFDEVFDDKQCFLPLINRGWMERISTQCVRKSYTKNDIFKTVSNDVMRFPLQVQLSNPRHSCDRVFLVADDWQTKVV